MRYQTSSVTEIVFLWESPRLLVFLDRGWWWAPEILSPHLVICFRPQPTKLKADGHPKVYTLGAKISPWTFDWFKNRALS